MAVTWTNKSRIIKASSVNEIGNFLDGLESSTSCTSYNKAIFPGSGCSADRHCTANLSGDGTRYSCSAEYYDNYSTYYGTEWFTADWSMYTGYEESENVTYESGNGGPACDIHHEDICAEDKYCYSHDFSENFTY